MAPREPARPITIAHRAANDLNALAEAFARGVDYAEADLWLYRGRLEVRHEKTAGPLPLLWDWWYVRPGWGRRLLLPDLLAAAGPGKLLLDLKSRGPAFAPAVDRALREAGKADAVAFTGGAGRLDPLVRRLPRVPAYYTAGSPGRLAVLRPRLTRREIRYVSIDSRFLTRDIVDELRDAGVESIITWAVETEETARRVLGWGVTGITSDDLDLLGAVRDGALSG